MTLISAFYVKVNKQFVSNFLQDFTHNFIGTVNTYQYLKPTPVPDVAFPIDVFDKNK